MLRMQRRVALLGCPTPDGFRIDRYDPVEHHEAIPILYSQSFGDDPWRADWDSLEEFDPRGAFVAGRVESPSMCGFALSFRRADFGYISVVGVVPEYRRPGIASALVGSAVDYLGSLGLDLVRIDAWEDAPAAVAAYRSLGFEIYERRLETD